MAETCTAAVSPRLCGHYVVTIAGLTFEIDPAELIEPTDEQRIAAYKLLIADRGMPLATLLNRVIRGDEATNVKIYSFFGPGAAITKTNIGTAFVNICPGLDGERIVVDFTGCTEYRLQLHCNVVGGGQLGVRVVRDVDDVVLHEALNVGAAGERGPDTDWQPLPAAFIGEGMTYLRAQAKSTTPQDDPVFRSLRVGLR